MIIIQGICSPGDCVLHTDLTVGYNKEAGVLIDSTVTMCAGDNTHIVDEAFMHAPWIPQTEVVKFVEKTH